MGLYFRNIFERYSTLVDNAASSMAASFFAATAIRNNFRSNVSLWLTLGFASSSEEPKVERCGSAGFLNLARLVDGRMVDAGYDTFSTS